MLTQRRAAILLAVAMFAGPPSARADVVLDWNQVLLDTLPAANPFVFSRVAATAHLAIFEAVNAITADHEPYLGTIAAPAGASAEAAAVMAAHDVLLNYFPAAAMALSTAREQSLASIPDGPQKDDGIAVGKAAAAALIARRANDGSAPPQFFLPDTADAGDWQLTPSCSAAGGVAMQWGAVDTFGVRSGSQFRAAKPPTLTSERYRRAYDEVKEMGAADSVARPQDRADVAQFYNGLFPGPLWNRVARQLAELDGGSLSAHARAFALVNMAMADGIITVWESKYHHRFWRPETAIRAGASDRNGRTDANTTFAPFITTPCHPSYPSGHAGVSNSARGVIEALWGDAGHSIVLDNPPASGVVLHYATLSDIATDIDDARVYGGIHFRFDQDAGTRLGNDVADYILKRNLRPRR